MDSSLFDIFYKSSGLCTDTRAISANCLFVCIKGDYFDGNKTILISTHQVEEIEGVLTDVVFWIKGKP